MLCSYKVPFSTYLLPQHLNFYFHSYHCTCIRRNILRLTIGLFFERRVVWWLNYHNWMHEKLSSDNSAIMIIQTGELHFLPWASDDMWVKYYASSVLKIRTIRHARRLSKLAWCCKWLQNADVVDKIIWNYFVLHGSHLVSVREEGLHCCKLLPIKYIRWLLCWKLCNM